MSEATETTTVSATATEAPKADPAANEAAAPLAPAKPGLYARAAAGVSAYAGTARARMKAFFDPARLRPGARIKFAASIAAALLAGASFGALATTGYGYVKPVPAPRVDAESLHAVLTQISAEVATLKTALDSSTRNANAQIAKVGDRLDRVEKALAEPSAKLARINEAIERIEKRPPAPVPNAAPFATAAAASDVTGSVIPKQPPPQVQRVPVVEGWVLRDIFDGTALIEGPRGLREVGPGSNIPGVGRVEQIKRHDGRWMVFTSRGVIVSSR